MEVLNLASKKLVIGAENPGLSLSCLRPTGKSYGCLIAILSIRVNLHRLQGQSHYSGSGKQSVQVDTLEVPSYADG